jgi:hypothetical protein
VTPTSPPTFTYDDTPGILRLDHPLFEAEWTVRPDGRIDFSRLASALDGTEWIAAQPHEPIALVGVEGMGHRFHPFDQPREFWAGTVGEFRLNEPGTRGAVRAEVTIDLSQPPGPPLPAAGGERPNHPSAPPPLRLTWTVEAHPAHATIRQWFSLVNDGTEDLTITRLPLLLTQLRGSAAGLTAHSGLQRKHRFRKEEGADWFTWQELVLKPGVVGTIESGHRRGASWLGLTTAEGPGLYVGWESTAATLCEYGDLHGSGACCVDVWIAPDYRLAPGGTLTSPPAFLGIAHGDLDELSYRTQRFVEDIVARPVDDDRFPYVAFNSWGYGDQIDDASMRRCFARCQELGIELFVVDFGWEDPEWRPRKDLFPEGFAPLVDAAHAAGMKFGVHLSFGNVSSLARMYQDHPEWTNGPGQWAYLTEGEVHRMVLGNPAARDWMIDKLVSIVDETRIDYFLTDHFLWGPVNPDVQDMRATDDYLTVAEGYDLIIKGLLEQRPHVMVEHCDNGLAFPTYGMVANHVTSIGPDAVGSQYERIGTWRLSHVLPPRYLDHYVCERLAPQISFNEPFGDYEYRSQIFGGPMILMTDILGIEPGDSDWNALTRTIDLFKRIRRKVADGKVLHLLEPQPYERVGDGWDGWDAIGSYHEQSDSAVVLAFRLGGDLDARTIPLHGLQPGTTYSVTFEDRADVLERSGTDLMRDGLHLTLPGPGQERIVDGLGFVRASEVIHLTAVATAS